MHGLAVEQAHDESSQPHPVCVGAVKGGAEGCVLIATIQAVLDAIAHGVFVDAAEARGT